MNIATSLEARLHRMGMICFVIVASLGGLVLLAWRLGQPRTGVFYLATGTLVSLLGLSISSWLTLRPSKFGPPKWIGRAIGMGALGMSLVACVQFLKGQKWLWEEKLAGLLPLTQDVSFVPMSKTAAFGFLLASVACLAQCHPATSRRAWRQVAAVLALAELLLGLVLLLCYLLQSEYYASMAFLGAVGLFLMGLGLLLTAGPHCWPLKLFLFPAVEERSVRRFIWAMLSLALLLAVIVVATGRFYAASQQANARLHAWEGLTTVADLKVAQIAGWWSERLADANYLRYTPYVARRGLDVLTDTRSTRSEQVFRAWLQGLFADKTLDRVLLLDEHFNVRLTHPQARPVNLSPTTLRAAQEATVTKKVVVAGLDLEGEGGQVQMNLVVPLVARREGDRYVVPAMGVESLPTDEVKGVVLLQVNAEKGLYPMLASWPTLSATSEIVLLQQDGDDALVLNNLRTGTNTALAVRVPVDRRTLEGRALTGGGKDAGELKGFDYRYIPTLGVWRKVPNTPWTLLAKVDVTEINAPILRQAWTTAGLVGLLVGAAMLGVALLERQRHLVSVRRELLLERQHREAEQKFHTLFESSRDAIMLLDRGIFYDCNQATLDLFGCASRDQFLARHPSDFSPRRQADGTNSRAAAEARIASADRQGVEFFEWLHRRTDGTVFPAEVLLSRIELDGKTVLQGVVRDITERKRAEAALLEISDREQARIGHDLHDGLCQHLVVTAFAANALQQKLTKGLMPDITEARNITALLDDAITQARNTARGLYPVQLEAEGLAAALRELAASVSRRSGLACEVDYSAPVLIRDNGTAIQLFRIAQEAVNNAMKHAHPKRIELRLVRNGRQIELTILDDGVGLPEPFRNNGGMGLSIMEYRARTIGGTLRIRRRPEGGTVVSCFVREKLAPEEAEPGEKENPSQTNLNSGK